MKGIIWEEYQYGRKVKLGTLAVGGVSNDAFVSRQDPKKYAVWCRLPGIKQNLGHFVTKEEGEKTLEKVIEYWLNKANLKIKEVGQ